MRIAGMVLFLIILQVSIGLFDNTLHDNNKMLNQYTAFDCTLLTTQQTCNTLSLGNSTVQCSWDTTSNTCQTPTASNGTLSLLSLVFFNWNSNFIAILLAVCTSVFVFAVASSFIFRSDLVSLFPLLLFLMPLGSLPIASLAMIINREVTLYACDPSATSCMPATLAATLVAGPLAIYWAFAIVEYWSARPTT